MGMLAKIEAAYACLQAGKQLANPGVWANRAALKGALAALLTAGVALARATGYDIDVGGVDMQSVALGLATLFGIVSNLLHVAANADAGLRPPRES